MSNLFSFYAKIESVKLIVGLGNPQKKYHFTRHNLGFWVVEALLRKLAPLKKTRWQVKKKLQAEIARVGDLVLAKPLTSMNASGLAVQKLAARFRPHLVDIWLAHDDLDLPLGKIRIVQNRGAAGHRGVESVIQHLGTKDFNRIRLGIGPSRGDPAEFVLREFEKKEQVEAKKMVKKVVKMLQLAIKNDIEIVMNRYRQ